MPRDFFDPTPDQQNVVLVTAETVFIAQRLIDSCEHCNTQADKRNAFELKDYLTSTDEEGVTMAHSR